MFSNVHKKHQFAELYNIDELTPTKLAKVPGVLNEGLRKSILKPAIITKNEQESLKMVLANNSKLENAKREY